MTVANAKIAVLGTLPPLRGLSSYCYEFTKAVAEHHAIDFISFKKLYPGFLYPGGNLKEDPSFPPLLHRNLTVRRRLSWDNPVSWLVEGFASNADLLHAQWWSLPLAPIFCTVCAGFKLRAKPVVATIHNVIAHERGSAYRSASSALYRFVDHFIVHTQINADQLHERFAVPLDKISVIAHGPLDFHVSPTADRDAIRKEMGFSSDHQVILLFGAIRPYKGIRTAIDAVARLQATFPRARLIIAGKPWESWSPYHTQIKTLGIEDKVQTHLRYIPSKDVHRYFTAADLILLPYHHFDSQTGAGSVALSFSKPIIVSDVGGLPELVRDARWVVPPRSPAALAAAMAQCLGAPGLLAEMAKDTAIAARQSGWPSIAKKTALVYKSLLDR